MGRTLFLVMFSLLCGAIVLQANNPQNDVVQKIVPNQAKVSDISGYYLVSGELKDKNYHGIVNLIPTKNSGIYIMVSMVDREIAKGLVIYKNDTVSVSWTTEAVPYGLTVLNREGKNFSGVWTTLPGNGEFYRENWSFLSKHPE